MEVHYRDGGMGCMRYWIPEWEPYGKFEVVSYSTFLEFKEKAEKLKLLVFIEHFD